MYRSDESNILDGINNNTYNMLFIDKLYNTLVESDREVVGTAIESFTKLNDDEIDIIVKEGDIFKRNNMSYEINYNSQKYDFTLLDYFYEDEELRNDKRKGKCICKSINLAYSYDKKCKVSIGYLDNKINKILHAVFIKCDDEKEYVFDYTMNLVMKKEKYIELYDFKIINEVDGEDIKKDIDILCNIEYLSSKFYLCFRNEFMNDLKKNSKILKLED